MCSVLLCSKVQYRVVLNNLVLYSIVEYSFVLSSVDLHCAILCSLVVWFMSVKLSTKHYSSVYYNTLDLFLINTCFLQYFCCLVPRCNSTVTCINIVIYSLLLYKVFHRVTLKNKVSEMLFTHFSLVCYGMLLCYFRLLYHHYIIVSSLYHHYIIIGLQPADSRRDSLKKAGVSHV